MRNFLVSAALLASTVAAVSPATAQWAPPPPPYGNAYGYQNNYGQVRSLQVRIDQIQRRIERLRNVRAITRNEANGLRSESRGLERRLRAAASYGLHPRERYDIEMRIARLEQHVRHEVRDGRRGGYNRYGYNNGYRYDRDHDGRDDRYEDDRGRRHD